MAEILRIAQSRPLTAATRATLFLVLFALPWVDRTNIATLLICLLGLIAIGMSAGSGDTARPAFHKVFWLFILYYAGYLLAWAAYPDNSSVQYALQQKIAFAAIPAILTVLLVRDPELWPLARIGFVSGTFFALLCCLAASGLAYLRQPDTGLFYYHDLVKLLSANAIYTSLHVLVSIVYVIHYLSDRQGMGRLNQFMLVLLLVSLFGGLLLLSSKLLIIAGAILILCAICVQPRAWKQRIGLALLFAALLGFVFITQNRINQRFSVVAWQQPDVALKYQDYSTANFDGLNLRLLLWRMGAELLSERDAWLTGLGGKQYHGLLNEKIAAYKLYEGYQDIDLHNQYMEALVGFGIGGLLLWLFVPGYMLIHSVRKRNLLLVMLTFVFSVTFLTESVLETQAGILIFTVVISGEWIQGQFT